MVYFAKYDSLFPAGLYSDELVLLQPVEYNSYFAGACISWRRDANGGAWQPHYRITDHLGSTRLETKSNGTITAAYDYKPFGEQIPLMTTKTRKTYIGKERDDESYLGDFGVRKYDYGAGRFTSPDVLWEKYMTWSPYQYCMNNPISASDPSGLDMIIYYRASNFFSFDPGHISFEVTDKNGKRLGSWSFTPKNISKNNFPQIFSRTPSRQADINWDKEHKDAKLLIKTNEAFDKILVKKINDKIKENLDYGLPYRNCATTTNELIQDALNEYGSDVKIQSIYQLRLTPQTSFENLKEKKTIIEKNLNKGE